MPDQGLYPHLHRGCMAMGPDMADLPVTRARMGAHHRAGPETASPMGRYWARRLLPWALSTSPALYPPGTALGNARIPHSEIPKYWVYIVPTSDYVSSTPEIRPSMWKICRICRGLRVALPQIEQRTR